MSRSGPTHQKGLPGISTFVRGQRVTSLQKRAMASASAQSNVKLDRGSAHSRLHTWPKVLRSLARAAERSKQVSGHWFVAGGLRDPLMKIFGWAAELMR